MRSATQCDEGHVRGCSQPSLCFRRDENKRFETGEATASRLIDRDLFLGDEGGRERGLSTSLDADADKEAFPSVVFLPWCKQGDHAVVSLHVLAALAACPALASKVASMTTKVASMTTRGVAMQGRIGP